MKGKKILPTLASIFERMERGFSVLHEGQEQIKEQLSERAGGLERRMSSVEDKLEDISDTLDGVARAVDKDAITALDHERRIRRLEKTHA
ncbi:MAG: hypothetical protein Q7R54_03510 [bacterium]|nr:hypothetical protein [bacterium]